MPIQLKENEGKVLVVNVSGKLEKLVGIHPIAQIHPVL